MLLCWHSFYQPYIACFSTKLQHFSTWVTVLHCNLVPGCVFVCMHQFIFCMLLFISVIHVDGVVVECVRMSSNGADSLPFPEGRPRMSDVFPLFGISGLSFDYFFLPGILLRCPVPVLLVCLLFPCCWPIPLFSRTFFSFHWHSEDGLFCMALYWGRWWVGGGGQLGDNDWSVTCAPCCHMALVLAMKVWCNFII